MSSFWIRKSYSHFFNKNTCELDIVLTTAVNILTTNEFVKLTMHASNNWALVEKYILSCMWGVQIYEPVHNKTYKTSVTACTSTLYGKGSLLTLFG